MPSDRTPSAVRTGSARRSALCLAALAALCLPALSGCGGGISLNFGYDGFNDRPPSVSLAVSVASATRGQTLGLVAAASDDVGVDAVEFYRLDAGGATLLGVDRSPPYELSTSVPTNATGSVQFVARAFDGLDQRADSAVVSVSVLP